MTITINNLKNQSLFLQIAETIKDRILDGTYKTDDKIPSVREMAIEMEVNPNTVMRAYERLQWVGIVYAKRGLGQFVSSEACEMILQERRDRFLKEIVPAIKKEMEILRLDESIFKTNNEQS